MARPLRIQYDGAVYHVSSRGNARKPIFKDQEDRIQLLNTLHQINNRFNWLCHAYCLMNNHFHLIIETPDGNLSSGMRQLNGIYTQRFNRKHHRVGHVFQGRFKAILVEKETYLLELCRYVVLNPVRSHTVEDPRGWKWSSYSGTGGIKNPHPCLTIDWILGQFGTRKITAHKLYRRFVKEGIGKNSIWSQLKGQSLLGEGKFVDLLAPHLRRQGSIKEIPRKQRFVNRPGLATLFTNILLRNKSKRNGAITKAVGTYGYTQMEVADFLGMHYSTISRLTNEPIK